MLKKLDDATQAYEKKEPIYSLVFGECPNLQRCEDQADVWNMSDHS